MSVCRKGYISAEDLQAVFGLIGESVPLEELQSKCGWRDCVQR